MALPLLFWSSLSSSTAVFMAPCSKTMAITASPIFRLHMKPTGHHLKCCIGFCDINKRKGALIFKASFDTNGPDHNEAQSESDDEEDLPLDKLPLDSKLQLKLEKRMRARVSKKIRLRRKKLIHKRRMRKQGRWPPSKMNKLKNV